MTGVFLIVDSKSFMKIVSRALGIVLAVHLLNACVTTKSGGFDPEVSVDEAVAIRVSAAKQYLKVRDFEKARRHLRLALEQAPRSPDVHDALALSFQYSNEMALADKHFKQAVSLGNGESRFRNNYATFLYQQERFKEARKQLEKVANDSLYDRRESALVLLGLTQQQLIDTQAATRSFEQALVLNPGNALVLQELSIINYDAGELSRSWSYFKQYRRAAQQSSAKMLLLGIQLANKFDDKDSMASFVLSLKNLYPESREYQSYLREFGA